MPFLTNLVLQQSTDRVFHLHVPANPAAATAPAIIVFHGGGQDPQTIARRWGFEPGAPVPANVADYLIVFPEADARLGRWVHYRKSDSAFPTLDLEFVDALLGTLASTQYATGSAFQPTVSADPDLGYAAGFSNGASMVWQLMNSDLVDRFQGFAAVGMSLAPEKAQRYRRVLAGSGAPLLPVPVVYIHGTGDQTYRAPATLQEVPIDTTFPAQTVREMLDRNGVLPTTPSVTSVVPGSVNVTEVVVQEWVGTAAFTCVTVLNGGHNWPGATTTGNPPVAGHFEATQAILDFWHAHASLP